MAAFVFLIINYKDSITQNSKCNYGIYQSCWSIKGTHNARNPLKQTLK